MTEHEPSRSSAPTPAAAAGRVRARPLAAAEQLGPLGRGVRGRRLRAAHAGLARRSRDRRARRTRTPRSSRTRRSGRSPTTSQQRHPASCDSKPAVIGHSFGGLLAQILAGRGLLGGDVAIDPAPFRGVLPLPFSALKSACAGARQPGQSRPRRAADVRAVPLRVRERGERGGGEGALRDLRRAGARARRCSRPRPPT